MNPNPQLRMGTEHRRAQDGSALGGVLVWLAIVIALWAVSNPALAAAMAVGAVVGAVGTAGVVRAAGGSELRIRVPGTGVRIGV